MDAKDVVEHVLGKGCRTVTFPPGIYPNGLTVRIRAEGNAPIGIDVEGMCVETKTCQAENRETR